MENSEWGKISLDGKDYSVVPATVYGDFFYTYPTPECLEWEDRQPKRVRGALRLLAYRVLNAWSPDFLSYEWIRGFQHDAQEDLRRRVCVKWESPFPRKVTIGSHEEAEMRDLASQYIKEAQGDMVRKRDSSYIHRSPKYPN